MQFAPEARRSLNVEDKRPPWYYPPDPVALALQWLSQRLQTKAQDVPLQGPDSLDWQMPSRAPAVPGLPQMPANFDTIEELEARDPGGLATMEAPVPKPRRRKQTPRLAEMSAR